MQNKVNTFIKLMHVSVALNKIAIPTAKDLPYDTACQQIQSVNWKLLVLKQIKQDDTVHDTVQLSVAEHTFVCQVILQKTYDGIILSGLPDGAMLNEKHENCGKKILIDYMKPPGKELFKTKCPKDTCVEWQMTVILPVLAW